MVQRDPGWYVRSEDADTAYFWDPEQRDWTGVAPRSTLGRVWVDAQAGDYAAATKRVKGRAVAAMIIGTLALAAAIAIPIWWENSTAAAQQQAASFKADAADRQRAEEQTAAAAAAQAEADRQASVKSQMEAQGWTQASGYSYYQGEDPQQHPCHNTIPSIPCVYVFVVSMAPNGCPGGFYVEASIERSGVSIGMANGVTAGLAQGKPALVKLEDATGTGGGNTFQLTKVTCNGG